MPAMVPETESRVFGPALTSFGGCKKVAQPERLAAKYLAFNILRSCRDPILGTLFVVLGPGGPPP
jgi:hypothetical protein